MNEVSALAARGVWESEWCRSPPFAMEGKESVLEGAVECLKEAMGAIRGGVAARLSSMSVLGSKSGEALGRSIASGMAAGGGWRVSSVGALAGTSVSVGVVGGGGEGLGGGTWS